MLAKYSISAKLFAIVSFLFVVIATIGGFSFMQMRAINAAYGLLSDPARRAAYDAQRFLHRSPVGTYAPQPQRRTFRRHGYRSRARRETPALTGRHPSR